MDDQTRGEIIKEWRLQAGLRREEVASACKVALSTVLNWEHGRPPGPRLKDVQAMEELRPGLLKFLETGL